MSQTAVEYLVEQLLPKALSAEQYYYIQQAKEMEKKQIIMSFYEGQKYSDNKIEVFAFGENYYKETFKK